jgi:hypothetical protein
MIRVSGGPFEKLESLKLTETPRLIDTIAGHKEKLDPLKQSISDELYQLIPGVEDKAMQNLLVKIRRDVFNERNVSPERMERIKPHLPESLTADIAGYLRIREDINGLREEGETLFAKETEEARKILASQAMDEDLQNGLLLSSQSLFKRIPDYVKKVEKQARLKKKDFQVERGLTKYTSRMYGKTSPFSTFTNLVIGNITADAPPPDSAGQISPLLRLKKGTKPKVLNHIRINNFLYQYLNTMFTKNPGIFRHFLIRPNPTLKKNEDHYLFLTNSNNIEAFQRIPANPALEVFTYLSTQKKEGIVYNEMVRSIIENEYIDAPAETLEDFINQLLDYGFLEFNIGVSGIDPDWDKELAKKLKHLETELPLIKELLATLKKVRTLADRYGESSSDKRTQILNEAFEDFRAICMKLHEDAGLPEDERKTPEELQKIRAEQMEEAKKEEDQKDEKKGDVQDEEKVEKPEGTAENDNKEEDEDQPFKQVSTTYFNFKPENMFYEDTSLDVVPQLDEKQVLQLTGILNELLQKVISFEGMFDERGKMLHYFSNKYGTDASIDMLTFYEDYYREFKKPEAKRQEKKEQDDAPPIPVLEKRTQKNAQWREKFLSLMKDRVDRTSDEVNVSLRDLEDTEKAFPDDSAAPVSPCSFGSFIHFFVEKTPQGEKLMGVLNSSFPGFGKMFSRFLHIFDDVVTADMRRWNESLAKESDLLLEDSDASYFNANLHPPLMPFEIRTPNGHNSLPSEKQIPVTELQVRVNEAENRLQLVHAPTGKRAYVFDLGFQGHRGRSQLFQLLEKFSLARYLYPHPVLNGINTLYAGEKEKREKVEKEGEEKEKPRPVIRIQPRVVYQDRIILQRKTWYVPRELLPLREPQENDWAWFCRVNEWRIQQGMPEEVFIFVVDRSGMQNIKPEAQRKISRDDYKPQYISFKNPFLINLLEKGMSRVPDVFKIVEMLPNSRQLLGIGSNRYITEFVLQWYTDQPKRSNRESVETQT